MIANHIHDALAQVRKMQELILVKRNFTGYSGTARMIGGAAAIAGAAAIHFLPVHRTPEAHLIVWGIILAVSVTANYAALAWWFFRTPGICGDIRKLLPAVDALPALLAGAVLSAALIVHQEYGLLFGAWMTLFGLAHISYRLSLPGKNYLVGIFYILSGSFCLFFANDFLNPWPMGIVFFIGETMGGLIFNRRQYANTNQQSL